MDLQISHLTRFDYDREVQLHLHLLYLRPRENPLLEVQYSNFIIAPEASVHWMRDDFDNLPATVEFSTAASSLEIRSECAVTTSDLPPFDFLLRDYARVFPFAYEPLHAFNLGIYLVAGQPDARAPLRTWLAERMQNPPQDTVAWLFAVNQVVHRQLRYQRRNEPGIQAPLTTLELGSGSCRDFAVFLVEMVRAFGLAARFVSGYVLDALDDGRSSADMHAWVEVFLPGAGWRGMDPTHGIFCDNAYVPVAHAVVAESVNPIQSSFFSEIPATARMTTDVRVRRAG
jgi:transglutaminase-like putative cysteine protease